MKAKNHLFAYGTLICADILAEVAGCRAVGESAVLRGYDRRQVIGADYPGILPQSGGTVEGLVYRDLPPAAWCRLDRFEGEMYRRVTVAVRLASGGKLQVQAYVVRPAWRHRLGVSDWDRDGFLREGKARFRRAYRGYR